MSNAISWFEIPVKNFNRAKSFYEEVLEQEMSPMKMGDHKSAFFNADLENEKIGGCIMHGPSYEPSTFGSDVYLNDGDDLANPLSRIEGGGGKILMPKTDIGQNVFIAHFEDTEGNRVAFHSRS